MNIAKQGGILIIDDDENVAQSMIRMIEKTGVDTDFSLNLKDGLQKIFNHTYDIVFLDVNLPDGNGVDAIKEILAHQDPPQVIIMTAYSNPDGAELAIENGAWDYLKKPAYPKDIRLQIPKSPEISRTKETGPENHPI